MVIEFLGAAQTVTGSKYLIRHGAKNILVDCGLFQGKKELRKLNWEELPIKESDIDAVFLTHAHIDHSGYLPRLAKMGFRGEVYMTRSTRKLVEILLRDSALIQVEEAKKANKLGRSKHKPAKPLYDPNDVNKVFPLIKEVDFFKSFQWNDLDIEFFPAGHILGASSIKFSTIKSSILFSGDLGRMEDPIMHAPFCQIGAENIIVESTYGNRLHKEMDVEKELISLLKKVKEKKSILMIPAFAVGRAQLLNFHLYKIMKEHPELKLPVVMNSPMTSNVTEVYKEFSPLHKLSHSECEEIFNWPRWVQYPRESKQINDKQGPMVILAASGMLSGGRILEHLKTFSKDENNILLLVGFQAEGTRGRDIENGEKVVKVDGEDIEINCEVLNFEYFSAHGDQFELLYWLGKNIKKMKPKRVIITHGEPEAQEKLKELIEEQFDLEAIIPANGDHLNIEL